MDYNWETIIERAKSEGYFGKYGALEFARKALAIAYEEKVQLSVDDPCDFPTLEKITLKYIDDLNKVTAKTNYVTLIYACTLYCAFKFCTAHLKRFHLWYLWLCFKTVRELSNILDVIDRGGFEKTFNVLQKENLLQILLDFHYMRPFSNYRERAIIIGEGILRDCESKYPELNLDYPSCGPWWKKQSIERYKDYPYVTILFVMARLSSIPYYYRADEFVKKVTENITSESMQIDMGWENVGLLAGIIGEEALEKFKIQYNSVGEEFEEAV